MHASAVTIEPPAGTPKPPFAFSAEDDALLDEVQRGAWQYFWNHCSPKTGMVVDRSSKPVVSVAGVGFQLSAIPIAVSRGWISREAGLERARLILNSLSSNPENRKFGLFFHYLGEDAGPTHEGYEVVVSTIDSALLFSGIITASSFFGDDIADLAEPLIAAADWKAFVSGDEAKPHERGFISLGWKPSDPGQPTGDGSLLPYYWLDSGDEHRLVTFLAVAAADEASRAKPDLYYRLRRGLGQNNPGEPMVYFPWSGALFTAFFAHCWINYAAMGPDNPAAFKVDSRARVDWWENSRRIAMMHHDKCAANPRSVPGLSAVVWGLSASDFAGGYQVPGLFPAPITMVDAVGEVDFSPFVPEDNYGDGTVAPYAAGSCVMFEPALAVAALRHYRSLTDASGAPLVWRDPANGGCGFLDAFNLGGSGWVASDYVAIDQGPLLLAIENARTGLIWRLFHAHPAVQQAMNRLGLALDTGAEPAKPDQNPNNNIDRQIGEKSLDSGR
ncbi:MAG: DUF3131 domain-containing protein [Phycisphaeraceae bacterium]|nr:DUF3131 domain-containing protein [Phycisphaeraceae bacterium]